MRDDPDFVEWLRQGAAALGDCRRRLWWGENDGGILSSSMQQFVGGETYLVEVRHSDGHGVAILRRQVDEADEILAFDEFSRLLGSYLDNMRSALNYLTYQVALLALSNDPSLGDPTKPPDERLHPEAVEFPIFNERRTYEKHNRIKRLPNDYRQLFEAVQPFEDDEAGLWLLHELSRVHRHRLVHAMAILPRHDQHLITVNGESLAEAAQPVLATGLQDGQAIFEFSVGDVPDDAVLEVRAAITIGIDHPLCVGRGAVEVLNGITADVVEVVERFAPLFE